MKRHWLVALSVGAVLASATAAPAQAIAPAQWHKGTALAIFAGAASATGGTDGAAGASIGWELTPHFTLEGSGLWMPGRGADAFSALFGSRVNLLSPRGAVPFVSAGVGVHRATVDVGRSSTPAFYMRRMGMPGDPGPRMGMEQTFDDFVIAVGGGVDIYLKQHLALRPDVRVLLVHANSDIRPVAVYGVHLAYHFEDHPITP